MTSFFNVQLPEAGINCRDENDGPEKPKITEVFKTSNHERKLGESASQIYKQYTATDQVNTVVIEYPTSFATQVRGYRLEEHNVVPQKILLTIFFLLKQNKTSGVQLQQYKLYEVLVGEQFLFRKIFVRIFYEFKQYFSQ